MSNVWERFHPLAPVRDGTELSRRYRILHRVVRLPGDGTLRLVGSPGWVAVPESSGVPSHDDAERLATICQREGRDRLWGLSLEERDVYDPDGRPVEWPYAFDVPATREGIAAFIATVPPAHYALLPGDASWVVLSMLRDDLQVILGPAKTAAEILGRPLVRAYEDYEAIAGHYRSWRPEAADAMLAELEQLRDFYPRLPAGETLPLQAGSWATWAPLAE